MSYVVHVIIPPETTAVFTKIEDLPHTLPLAVKRGMDYALSIVRGRIQLRRLSGKGPYPPSEHRLGIVRGKLRESLREEPAVITDGGTITAAIGSNIFYGKLHEYGWSGKVVRGGGTPYTMNIPERAAVRTGVDENSAFIADEIIHSIDNLLEETAKP